MCKMCEKVESAQEALEQLFSDKDLAEAILDTYNEVNATEERIKEDTDNMSPKVIRFIFLTEILYSHCYDHKLSPKSVMNHINDRFSR